jgi:hypothetical protein
MLGGGLTSDVRYLSKKQYFFGHSQKSYGKHLSVLELNCDNLVEDRL